LDVPLSLTNTGLTKICTLIYISRLEPNNSNVEDVYHAVPILNEAVTKMLDTQLPQGKQPLDTKAGLNTTEGHMTSSNQSS